MRREIDRAFVNVSESLVDLAGQEKFLVEPQRQSHQKRPQAAWSIRDVRFHQPLEFEERLVVKDNGVELAGG